MIDMCEQRFGRLVVVEFSHRNVFRQSVWFCHCDCGNTTNVTRPNLISGGTESCGCLKSELVSSGNTTHGLCGTPEYESWTAMRARCAAKTGQRWIDYGSRGITVCDRWGSFEAFIEDMGRRLPGTSIDRIDNDLGYYTENCRWATPLQQTNNRRTPEQVALDRAGLSR